MKKFTKGCLLAAGILAVAGCMLCLVSVILRSANRADYEQNEYDAYMAERIGRAGEALEDAGIHGLGNIFRGVGSSVVKKKMEIENGKYPTFLTVNEGDTDQNKYETHVDVEEIEHLSLNLGAGRLVLEEKEAADGVIDLYIQGVGKCDYYVKKHTLNVEGFKGLHMIGWNGSDNVITLKLPKDMGFKEADLMIGAGEMKIFGIRAEEISAEVGAGTLTINRMQARELSAEIGAGEMVISDAEAEKADLEVSLGACFYQGSVTGKLDAECSMGSLEFALQGKEEDYNYEIECSAGSIDLNGHEYAAMASEKSISNGAHRDIELTCNMGEIAVNFDE